MHRNERYGTEESTQMKATHFVTGQLVTSDLHPGLLRSRYLLGVETWSCRITPDLVHGASLVQDLHGTLLGLTRKGI